MNRREFVAAAGTLGAFACATGTLPASGDESVKRTIEEYYAVYRSFDREKYRALLTDDYLLLENGELLDAAGDLASMPAAGIGYQRSDAFDFRLIRTDGATAYAVYFLSSDITDSKAGNRKRKWLESAILRRAGDGWRVALLHSTRIEPKPGAL